MNNLRKISFKNSTCYYFDKAIKTEDLNFDIFLLDEKSNENIFSYNISYTTLTSAKLLSIKFDKID